jgi:hypothetical protein
MMVKTAVMVVAAAVVVASPAFAQSYPTTHQSRFHDYGTYNYSSAPSASVETPATTGGGSIGYDNHLTKNY